MYAEKLLWCARCCGVSVCKGYMHLAYAYVVMICAAVCCGVTLSESIDAFVWHMIMIL